MSSPNHPTSNIEDAFSSNFLDFIPSLFLFHNDPYMKVLQAFYAKESPIPSPDPITPPVILTPSLKQIHPLSSSSTMLSNSSRMKTRSRISKFTTNEESFGTHFMSLTKLDFLPYTSDN
uniref:Reverse transcriptase domain-containing protein n=1 Tax=Tanacetum cinerariifolium TaxID=118510 RepID=A0A6L2NPK5_TANCI|nr:hypothetical protein [Tanacetum cinerariifolium]